jgi:transcriptional regulator with XRE-family HTH domain
MPATPMTAEEVKVREIICDRVMLVWEASGLSKQAFADAIGIKDTLLSNYRKRRSTPAHTVIGRICVKFSIPPSYFYPEAAKKRGASSSLVQRALELAAELEEPCG